MSGRQAAAAPPFVPQRLLRGFHAQTLAGAFWPRATRALQCVGEVSRRFRVTERDEVVALCHAQPRSAGRARPPVLLLVHGLTGSARSPYMLGAAEKACAAGLDVVRLNLRNCGDSAELCSTLYCGALAADVRAVAEELVARDGCPSVVLGGFSLGGNIVLRVAGEAGAAPPPWLAGVVTVCAALDLAACADRVDGQVSLRAYRRLFVAGLKGTLRARARLDPRRYDLRGLRDIASLRAFDDRYTGPDFGFSGAADYYARASALPLLPDIAVPTLLIASRDDAIVPHELLADPRVAGARCVQRLLTERGGHCGFVAAGGMARDADRFWAENRVVHFACEVSGARAAAAAAASDSNPETPA